MSTYSIAKALGDNNQTHHPSVAESLAKIATQLEAIYILLSRCGVPQQNDRPREDGAPVSASLEPDAQP